MKPRPEPTPRDSAFTLIEMMVVVVILALLALIAIPTLSRDSNKAKFEAFVNELHQTLQRAKMEAISSREPRKVLFASATSYQLQAYLPGTTTTAQLKQVTAPVEVGVVGYMVTATASCSGYNTSFPFEIQFSAVSDVALSGTASPVTICLHSTDNRYQARISISQTTGYIRTMEGW